MRCASPRRWASGLGAGTSRSTASASPVPEIVDPEGRITTSAVVKWNDLPVEASFAHLGPATVVTDMRAAALAEARAGAGRDFEVFAYVPVGTGINHCLVQTGRSYAGTRGAALLLGSGRLGDLVLEEVASGPAIAASSRRLGIAADGADEVLAAAGAGDPTAQRIVTRGC
jgi:glucokinase